MRTIGTWLVMGMLAMSTAAVAQSQGASRVASGDKVSVLSGGIGADARDQLAAQAKSYNLKLIFALSSGEYISDVNVSIADAAGRKVADHTSDGPWMFAELPPGAYTVTASFNGKTETHKVTVGKQGQKVVDFRWPTAVGSLAAKE
jgi:carboxypeptidase family protein